MGFFINFKRSRIYKRPVNNALPKRLNWERIESIPRQEGRRVVKGTSKRVVVVKSPDARFFEQAIFILREDILGKSGSSSGDVLREAQKVADDYVRSFTEEKKEFFRNFPPAFFAALGAVVGGLVCILICGYM